MGERENQDRVVFLLRAMRQTNQLLRGIDGKLDVLGEKLESIDEILELMPGRQPT